MSREVVVLTMGLCKQPRIRYYQITYIEGVINAQS